MVEKSGSNSSNVFFSVIIPVYNVEMYVEQCIESVLNQSCKDFEIILVDDGSTDGSSQICDAYAKRYSNVHVYHNANSGLSLSRNIGLDSSSGEYVLFLDSDDFYADLDIFTKLKQVIQAHNYDFVLFKTAKYYTDGRIVDYYGDYDQRMMQRTISEVFLYMVKENKQLATACNKAICHKLLCEHQIYFPLGTISEDVPWIVRLFEEAHNIGAINSIAYMYRQKRQGSISTEISSAKIEQLFDIVKGLSQDYKGRTDDFGKSVMSFISYEYAIVLYLAALTHEPYDVKELITYRWLLKYALDKKTTLVKWSYRLFGFHNTLRLLSLRKR